MRGRIGSGCRLDEWLLGQWQDRVIAHEVLVELEDLF